MVASTYTGNGDSEDGLLRCIELKVRLVMSEDTDNCMKKSLLSSSLLAIVVCTQEKLSEASPRGGSLGNLSC